jgi:hypothetical protein
MKDELFTDFGIASPQLSAAAFVILILSGFATPRCGATVQNSDGSVASVQALHNAAHDGDTITLPAGTFDWTAKVTITKGVTIQGQTTITGAGTANPTINDATILIDDTPAAGDIFHVTLNASQSFRLTGLTIRPGARTTFGRQAIMLNGPLLFPANKKVRIDHCNFDNVRQAIMINMVGKVYGVADHNVISNSRNVYAIVFAEGDPNADPGNQVWADYSWYGTDKFFFFEDNTVIATTTAFRYACDTVSGARWVVRHCYFYKLVVSDHGTEGGLPRTDRAHEVYDNTFESPPGANSQRGGGAIFHDNDFIGTGLSSQRVSVPNSFRATTARPNTLWGGADGTSVWDENDTDGQGHFVAGQRPFLFASGIASSGTQSESTATMTDSSANWIRNQWVGYSVKNVNPAADGHGMGSYIVSNTSNTLTYAYYSATDVPRHLTFAAGDAYEIHRCLRSFDTAGVGRGDLVAARNGLPYNTTTGVASYSHQIPEPSICWNNFHRPDNIVYGFGTSIPFIVENRDFFNLGGGFAKDSTPSEVSTRYTAAINGVQYTGTFVYPHPLVSGAPTPTPDATPISAHESQQKKKTKRKQLKRKKGGQKNRRMT